MPEHVEHDGGIELLIRYSQQLDAARTAEEDATLRNRYLRELTYRSAMLLEQPLGTLRDVLDKLIDEVAQARDAEHAEQAARRGLV